MINWRENDDVEMMIWNNYGREQDLNAIDIISKLKMVVSKVKILVRLF